MATEEQAKKEIVAALQVLRGILSEGPFRTYPDSLAQHPEVKKLADEILAALLPHAAVLDPCVPYFRDFLTCDVLSHEEFPVYWGILKDLDHYIKRFGGKPSQENGGVAEPKPEAFKAYWAQQAGHTQPQIAALLHTTQGTISKWLKKVEAWKAAGNAMPEIQQADPLKSKPTTMDPKDLDMGPRFDHRAPHQAEKLAGIRGHGQEE